MNAVISVGDEMIVLTGDVGDVVREAFLRSEDEDMRIVSVQMTPEEQRDAFDGMVTYYMGD
jgi:hypothetical protein